MAKSAKSFPEFLTRRLRLRRFEARDLAGLHACLGDILARSHYGKGLMTEALHAVLTYCIRKLNVHRVEAIIDPDNAASVRVVERLGFRREGGPLRDYWRVGDRYRSPIIYGLIADELKPASKKQGKSRSHRRHS